MKLERRRVLQSLRKRVSELDRYLDTYVQELRKRYPDTSILLVGSRAQRRALPYSDYDLVVVARSIDESRRIHAVIEMFRLKPHDLPLDLILVSIDELGDPLIAKMLSEGCVALHDGLGITHRLPCKQHSSTSSDISSTEPDQEHTPRTRTNVDSNSL